MPNKYSHSFVLSNYEKQGLTVFNDFERPLRNTKTPMRSDSPKAPAQSSRPAPYNAAKPRSTPRPAPPRSRLRLRDSRDLREPPPTTTSRTRRLSNDTVDLGPRASVKLHLPQASAEQRRSAHDSFGYYTLYNQAPPSRSRYRETEVGFDRLRVTDEVDEELDQELIFGTRKEGVATLRSKEEATRPHGAMHPNHIRRLTSDTAIWNPQSPLPRSPHPEPEPEPELVKPKPEKP